MARFTSYNNKVDITNSVKKILYNTGDKSTNAYLETTVSALKEKSLFRLQDGFKSELVMGRLENITTYGLDTVVCIAGTNGTHHGLACKVFPLGKSSELGVAVDRILSIDDVSELKVK